MARNTVFLCNRRRNWVLPQKGTLGAAGSVPSADDNTVKQQTIIVPRGDTILSGQAPQPNTTQNNQVTVPVGSVAILGRDPTVNIPNAWQPFTGPTFVEGTADTWSFAEYVPEGYDVFELSPDSEALPEGVTIDSENMALVYDGEGEVTTVSGIIIRASTSAEADWAARSGGDGVFYATNFDVENRTELLALAHSTVNATWSGNNKIDIETTLKRSGNAALRINLYQAQGANEAAGNFRASFAGPGSTATNVVKSVFYFQVTMYFDSTFARFGYTNGSKLFVLYHPTLPTFDWGEIVVNRRNGGWLDSYRYRTSTASTRFALNWPSISDNFTWHSFLNRAGTSTPVNTNTLQARHGYTQYDSTPSDSDFQWDPARVPDGGWMTFEVYVDAVNDIVKIWVAPTGEAPTLVMGGDPAGLPSVAQLGGDAYRGFLLLPRTEDTSTWPSADTFAVYDEVIASDDPIPFPGGFELPYPGTDSVPGFPWSGSVQYMG